MKFKLTTLSELNQRFNDLCLYILRLQQALIATTHNLITTEAKKVVSSVCRQHLSISTIAIGIASRLQSYFASSQLKSTYNRQNVSYTVTDDMLNSLPFFASGEIVRGFGRGSKELGIPTANYPLEVVKSLPSALQTGIYYGWANVDNGVVHKMVMSIGTNPYYDNKEKSMETHIIHQFNRDLYGQLLKVCVVGYLRPELNFNSLDDLIAAINNDIEQAKRLLDADEESRKLKDSKFFKEYNNNANQQDSHEQNSHIKTQNGCASPSKNGS